MATEVLGIKDPDEYLYFLARREQAIVELGARTVLERLLLDAALASNYLREKAITDGRMCQASFDEYLGKRYPNIPPNVEKAAEYLRNLEGRYTRMQIQLGRSMCAYTRSLNSLRRTQVTLQVKGVQNLNVAGQQINMQGTQEPDSKQDSIRVDIE